MPTMPPAKPAKIHLGLISQEPGREASFKEALAQVGGGYTHAAKTHLEMWQKMTMQKIDLLAYDLPSGETGAQAQALVQLFRAKRDFQKIPIALLTDSEKFEMKHLIVDPRVRAFSKQIGAFLPLMTLLPFLHGQEPQELQPLPFDWIQSGFLESLKLRIGNQAQLTTADATDDDLHRGFVCQVSEEIRSHLAWLKIGARILEGAGLSTMFKGLAPEMLEAVATKLLTEVLNDFHEQMRGELVNRGALFFPPLEDLPAAERKQVYAGSKSFSRLYQSPEISVLLEIIRYF